MVALAASVGCGAGPVPAGVPDPPAPTGADRAACLRMSAALPDSLGPHLDRRRVTPDSPYTAAWGSPTVVLRCGVVGVPRSYRPTSDLQVVNDVGWYAEDLGQAMRFTTVTRRPRVVLTVPEGAGQAFDVLATLADPVRRSTAPASP